MTEVSGAAGPTGPVARGNVLRVGAATAVTAVCSYAVIYLAARDLPAAGFSVFGVFWGALGITTGSANGLLQETTREVRSTSQREFIARGRVHPVYVAGLIGVLAAAFVLGTSKLWSRQIFVEERGLSVVLLSVALAGFCVQAALLGALAGSDRWTMYGLLMVTDAVIRVVFAVAVVLAGWGLAGFVSASAAGAAAWVLILAISPSARSASRQVATGGIGRFLRGAAHSIAAAGASAILVMGFPVLLKATSSQLGAQGGVVILAVTLTRAPLLIPLAAMQGNLVAHFVDQRTERLRALLTPALVIGGVGVLGVSAAGIIGPWLLRAGFGPDYNASGVLLAWLTTGAVALGMLTLTGTAAVAAALHRVYLAGWVGATIASALLLFLLPMALEARTVIALVFGPLVGIAIHLTALVRAPS